MQWAADSRQKKQANNKKGLQSGDWNPFSQQILKARTILRG